MNENELRALVGHGEGSTLEFKVEVPDPRTLARLIAAFANASGGTILIGVDDSGRIVGADLQRLAAAVAAALERLRPEPQVSAEETRLDGAVIGVISVRSSANPVLADGSALTRLGPMTRAMTPEQLRGRFETSMSASKLPDLLTAIAEQTETIERLRADIQVAGSLRSKLQDYLVGGIIGAILGWLITLLL